MGLSPRTVSRRVALGEIPGPVQRQAGAPSLWSRAEVERYLDEIGLGEVPR